ncbi:PAS domain-containing sensor histidine kinase [Arenibaculum pallidiluteum]|uniref:PAS domain-containing sensor histidine kinase n=1 Tax=Arenibaculum pallidiluteum TaxID=2812559 RepID=UPI001A9697C8|nr:ATP-binding protein [Arenibaculum pallidiluteum]
MTQPVPPVEPFALPSHGARPATLRRRVAGMRARRCAALLDGLPEAVLEIDPHGSVAGCNRAAEQLLGIPAGRAAGRTLEDLLGCGLPDEETASTRGWAPRDDGGRIPVELAAGPPVAGHRLVVLRDLRARLEAEERLREAHELAELARRGRTEFIANMSHELRTPLNAILGFAEIIRDQLVGPIGNPLYSEYARDVHDSGSHLLQVINDILDLAKVEAGQMTLREDLVMPAAAVGTCLRLLRQRADQAGVALVDLTAGAAPVGLLADERKLKQMLFNVIGNALKFTPEGGRVSVAIEVTPEAELAIIVRDTGIGIAAEDLERVMVPFGQAAAGLDRPYEGTGLGLPLTRGLVELHGGRLRLDSTPGEGTTVRLVFPAARLRPAPTAASAAASRAAG